MADTERTLVILLTMHRCGSSVTTRVLQHLGMSLGPFELNGAAPSNPHGHFESVPFLTLNRRIQERALGFPDDLPDSPETLARFLGTNGEWDEGVVIPDELYAEARSLIRALVSSGQISGFKDPRTILTWPFWKRVLEDFPDLRVVPVGLVRSPHEIAMSLVTRRDGWCGYWTSLDIVAVHFRRQKAILDTWERHPPSLCFGSPNYLKTLELVAEYCGLIWNPVTANAVFDLSCVHQSPASVHHRAQDLFEVFCEGVAPIPDSDQNLAQVERDARLVEAMRLEQWQAAIQRLADAREQIRLVSLDVDEARRETKEVEARLAAVRYQLFESHARLVDVQSQLIDEQRKTNAVQAQLIESRDRENHALQQNGHLRVHLQRMESHPLLGPALRVRRRMRRIVHAMRTNSANGHAVHRVDSDV